MKSEQMYGQMSGILTVQVGDRIPNSYGNPVKFCFRTSHLFIHTCGLPTIYTCSYENRGAMGLRPSNIANPTPHESLIYSHVADYPLYTCSYENRGALGLRPSNIAKVADCSYRRSMLRHKSMYTILCRITITQ